ncbi:MAG: hypothetical protein ABI051_13915 [Vicinamibacterales bacterium]
MTALSRRAFGRLALATVSSTAMIGRTGLRARGGVMVAVSSTSFRDLPRITGSGNLEDVVRATRAARATHLVLALANIEPAPPSTAPVMGGSAAYPRRIVLSPEEVASTNAVARAALRTWRGQAPLSLFEESRRTLVAGGLTLQACSVDYNDSFTDDEILATFKQAKALGVTTVSSPLTLAMAARLVPMAAHHQIAIAIQNQVDGNSGHVIGHTQLSEALALSPVFRVALDIGNVTASNGDPVRTLRMHQSRVAFVVVKDRLRNGGASQPFGEGDTPIADVIAVLETATQPIPAVVEYDYIGLRPVVDEVAAAVAYLQLRAH